MTRPLDHAAIQARAAKRKLAARVFAARLSSRSERELRRMKPGELARMLRRAADRDRQAAGEKEKEQ